MGPFQVRMLAALAIGITPSSARAEDAGRFYALFFDGSHVSAAVFPKHGWWSDEAMLGGRRLFGTHNPVRVLQDTTPRDSLKGPRVVMANGDVLPGKIVRFLPASPEDDRPARLLIRLDGALITADVRDLAVHADRVLRVTNIAHEPPAGEPGSLVLANGARFTATAIRWTDQGLQALTNSGVTTVLFDAIADLCLPKADVMRAVLDDGFYPPLGPSVVIERLETVQGAVLTYHREMTLMGLSKAGPSTRRNNPPRAYLLVQPNWSSAVILVPIDSIWRQSFRAAHEVPLSLLPARMLSQQVGLHRRPWRRNENVEGDTLASGSIRVDLGVGTHSGCEIAFDLPPQAKEFTTLVGLDRHMGPGACATCKIYPDQAADRPLFASGFLRGGQEPTPVGPLSVAGCRRLVLVTQWAGESRPQGAYPLDIGGHVDWLMPFVTIEADDASYCDSLRRFVPGWTTWELAPADARRVRVGPYWDTARECWLPAIYATGAQPLTIQRMLPPVSSANDLVELVCAHSKDAPLPVIELRVDGALLVPTTGQHKDHGAKPKPLLEQPMKGNQAAPDGRAGQKAGSGSPAKSVQQYRVRAMRWDLQRYYERPVQLTLSISLDKQPKGLIWGEFTTKPATRNSPPQRGL
ncbi:MAG: NPCBM/NEW2 domain-containing protein [Thermoguttaceae bacterium]